MPFTTRKSLLVKVRSGDEISWQEFYETYKPLILLCGNDFFLTPDENEELVQNVMCEFFQKDILQRYDPDHVPDNIVFKYDPAKGRFRHYFRKIVRNQALKIFRQRKDSQNIDDVEKSCLADDSSWNSVWDEEWRKHVFDTALRELRTQIKPENYLAFEMYAIHNRSVQEVTRFLNISDTALYTIKSRCVSNLRKIIANLEEEQ